VKLNQPITSVRQKALVPQLLSVLLEQWAARIDVNNWKFATYNLWRLWSFFR